MTSPDFAAKRVTTNQTFLRRMVSWSLWRFALRDESATLLAYNPETLSLAVNALVGLSPSTIPRIDIIKVSIDLCLGCFWHTNSAILYGFAHHSLLLVVLETPRSRLNVPRPRSRVSKIALGRASSNLNLSVFVQY